MSKKQEKKNDDIQKVLVMVLDNSGKTSIVLSLTKEVNLLNYLSLAPTTGAKTINYETDGKQFNIWDLGGQLRFREEYLENFDSYIKGIDKLLYVIDIQDVKRYDKALSFFEEIIKLLQARALNPDLNIFLHKNDPDLKELRPNLTEEMIEDLIKDIKERVPSEFYHEIFKTTIFTTFEKVYVH